MSGPKAFVLDVDGVLSTGQFFYSKEGKEFKEFGPNDNDGLSLLKGNLDIQFITGDRKGFDISHRRIVVDMGYPLELVSTVKRAEWLSERWPNGDVIFMGDGIFDYLVSPKVRYFISPNNAHPFTKEVSNYVCENNGGHGAVAEACLHILDIFFQPFKPENGLSTGLNLSREWVV